MSVNKSISSIPLKSARFVMRPSFRQGSILATRLGNGTSGITQPMISASGLNAYRTYSSKANRLSFDNSQSQSLPMNTIIKFVPQKEAWVVERMGKFDRYVDMNFSSLIYPRRIIDKHEI